jgi:hypothetical protein
VILLDKTHSKKNQRDSTDHIDAKLIMKRSKEGEDDVDDALLDDWFFSRAKRAHGGSTPGKAANAKRMFQIGHDAIMRDYLGPNPVYNEKTFRRRFRMPSHLFRKIVAQMKNLPFFQQRKDAAGVVGASQSKRLRRLFACWPMVFVRMMWTSIAVYLKQQRLRACMRFVTA